MDKKIKFGVIGTNFITDWMISAARNDPRFELAAVCSRHENTGLEFARKYEISKIYTSVDDLASDSEIEAVYVASPNAMHCRQSITLMNKGKHVLCEKPMASNRQEVEAMIAAAKSNKVVLMEAMRSTLNPNFHVIRENLWRVGTIRRYFASYCQYSSRYDALKEGRVANAFKLEMSNGALMDIGVYCIYPMAALFGQPDKIVSTTTLLPTKTDGQGTIICRYEGFDAVVLYSKIADSLLPSEIEGESGTLTIDRINEPHRVVFTPRDKSQLEIDLSVALPS